MISITRFIQKPFALFVLSLMYLITCSCDADDGEQDLPSGPGAFTTTIGGVNISGELFLPAGDGPFPVIVVVPGSGADPKEDSYAFNDIFLPQGFAMYHYDKRSIGNSTGAYPAETLETPQDFLNARRDDVLSVLQLLSSHTDIRKDKIGLLGASQGAWVNTLVYEATDVVDFIMMTVGGVTPTGIERFYDDMLTNDPALSIEEATERLYTYEGPLGFDPRTIVNSMSIPVGWVFGGQDRSHPSFYDIDVLEQLDKDNFSIYLFENSTHEMVDVNTGEFDPNLFPTILAWLNTHGK